MSLTSHAKPHPPDPSLLLPSPLRSTYLPIVRGLRLSKSTKASKSHTDSHTPKREIVNIEAYSCVGLKYLRPLQSSLANEIFTRMKTLKTKKLDATLKTFGPNSGLSQGKLATCYRTTANVRLIFGELMQLKGFPASLRHSRAIIVVIEVRNR